MCKYWFKKGCLVIGIFFCFFSMLFPCSGTVYAQTWQETLEQHFDIVETLDNLQDWHGTQHTLQNGEVQNYADPDDFPKHLDGSNSIWCMYSKYDDYISGEEENWISDFGAGTRIGETGKSAIVDLSNTRGPSRMAVYFGSGSSDSGYDDLYIFSMVKISRK